MSQQIWDVLVRGGTLYDGTAAVPCNDDIAIAGRHIAARGPGLDPARARTVIDARGRLVMPGLVDVHTHFDLEVELAPGLPEAVRHGTTTAVVSNCSLGLAFGAQRRDGADPIVDCFARVENMPKHVLRAVADRAEAWSDSGDYFAHLDTLPLGANIVPMIPHSMLRIEAMGLADSVARDPTEDELRAMERLVEKGMREGYAGFSTDALPYHYLANDPHRRSRIPAQFGRYDELKRLTDIVRRYDRVWQATPPKDRPLTVLRNFSLTSARLHGKPLKVTAVAALDVHADRRIIKLGRRLARLLNSRLLGGQFALQALAAPFKVWSEGPLSPLFEEIPEMRELNEPDLEDRAARRKILADPDYRRRFKTMWREGKQGIGPARLRRALRRETIAFHRDLNDMVVDRCPVAVWQGETLQSVFERAQAFASDPAQARDEQERDALEAMPQPLRDDADLMLHLLERYDTDLVWYSVTANRDPRVVRNLLMDPLLLPGFNDSGAHLNNMAFYDANLRALKIAQREGERALAYMVHALTRRPAELFDIACGRVDVGDVADVIVVDPQALARYDADAGTTRRYREAFDCEQLVNRSDGVVDKVIVGGRLAWDGKAYCAGHGQERFGRALRAGAQAAVTSAARTG